MHKVERPFIEKEESAWWPLLKDPVMASQSDDEGNYKGEKKKWRKPVIIKTFPSIGLLKVYPWATTVFHRFTSLTIVNPPPSKEATNCPEKVQRNETMGKEITSLKDKKVWKLIYTSWKEGNYVQQVGIQGHQ